MHQYEFAGHEEERSTFMAISKHMRIHKAQTPIYLNGVGTLFFPCLFPAAHWPRIFSPNVYTLPSSSSAMRQDPDVETEAWEPKHTRSYVGLCICFHCDWKGSLVLE